MKSDHRHELKTNELAEWIANFPEWAKENRTTLIGVLVVVIVAGGLYFWKFYRADLVSARNRVRLTGLITQLPYQKMQVVQAGVQGRDQSFMLLPGAQDLKVFADSTKDDQMAALALIKHAETLRSELRYRLMDASGSDLVDQINRARDSYNAAFLRASSNPALAAMAKYGLGLCEEELGNFDKAEQIYGEVTGESAFDGTAAQAAAKHRLATMSDYKGRVVFRVSPKPPSAAPGAPQIQIGPRDINLPGGLDLPGEVNLVPVTSGDVTGPNTGPEAPGGPGVPQGDPGGR